MTRLLKRIGVEAPVFQAGMGGGIARHELAAAVSEAGGLGTIGTEHPPERMARELAAARELTAGPIAVNLLLPFARREHWAIARRADAVITFWGRPIRRSPGVWLHQCGSVEEAELARASGADGVIVQGVEAGGHVRGTTPAMELLARTRAALGDDYPLAVAGGIAEAADVQRALDAGADAAVAGTRFVMSDESGARTAYKHRLMETPDTVLTELFGVGWPRAPHRVLWNQACELWLRDDVRGPAWVRAAQRPLSLLPIPVLERMAAAQRPDLPFLGFLAPTKDRPKEWLDSGPLYAGQTVARMFDIQPAGDLVRDLTP